MDNPAAELQKILAEPKPKNARSRDSWWTNLHDDFTRRTAFASVSPSARPIARDEALANSLSVRDLCAKRFKDFQFGLKLITQNSGPRNS